MEEGRQIWRPMQYMSNESEAWYDLVLLNQTDHCDTSLFKKLWKRAQVKVAVDGGANCLYNSFVSDRDNYLPDLLTGDFDSIQEKVKGYYKEKGVDIVETPDQDYTDFTKALNILSERSQGKQVESVVVFGSFGGRIDHVFAIVNTLFEASQFMDRKIMVMSPDSVAFLLQPGHHTIEVDPDTSCEWCGLIPVGEPCMSVTTQGLKWNLDNQKLKFGDLISTSNTLATKTTNTVTIQTDRPLLWTMGIIMGKLGAPNLNDKVYQMQKRESDQGILQTALYLDSYLYDSDEYEAEDRDDFFCPTFTIHGDVSPLEKYCQRQCRALQTEIFKLCKKNIYI